MHIWSDDGLLCPVEVFRLISCVSLSPVTPQMWSSEDLYPHVDSSRTTPVVDGAGNVYLKGRDMVYGLNGNNGTTMWSHSLNVTGKSAYQTEPAVAIGSDGTLYFQDSHPTGSIFAVSPVP